MFGRRASASPDAVAAARRRLAAMAAELGPAQPSPRVADAGDRGESPAIDAGDRGEARAVDAGAPGRHVGRSPAWELGRWDVTAQHLTLIALAVVAAVAVAAWYVLRSVPQPQPFPSSDRVLPATSATTSPSMPVPASGSAPEGGPDTAGARVVVDVTGKVRRPGIVELPPGSRVVDALREAGGTRPSVDLSDLNLARLLVDGEQIVVGLDVPVLAPTGSAATTGTGEPITPMDLNTATEPQLETLPGIGPVTAQAILTWRTEQGAFSSVDELLEVSGIGEATLADIAAYVYV